MWSFQTNTVTFYSLGARWVNQPTHEAQQRQVPNIPDIGDGKGEKTKRYIPKQHQEKREMGIGRKVSKAVFDFQCNSNSTQTKEIYYVNKVPLIQLSNH